MEDNMVKIAIDIDELRRKPFMDVKKPKLYIHTNPHEKEWIENNCNKNK